MAFDKKYFHDFMFDNNVLSFREEPFVFSSGRKSHFYINWRDVCEDVYSLNKLTDFVLDYAQDNSLKPDMFYGVPEGATKLGLFVQRDYAMKQENYKTGSHTLSMGRGNLKEHGNLKDRIFLGMPQGDLVIIEDVVTTGNSTLNEIEKIYSSTNANVQGILFLTDRMQKDDAENFRKKCSDLKIPYYSMTNIYEIFQRVIEELKPSKEILNKVIEEYDEIYN